MSTPAYSVSIHGNSNDSNLIIESAHGLISESSNPAPSPNLLQDVSDNSELLTQFQQGMQHVGGEAGGVNIYWAGGKSRLVPGVGQMYRFGDTEPGMFIRVPFDQEPVTNVSNFTGDPGSKFEGYYYQSIDDNIFRQWVLHLPKGKAKIQDAEGNYRDEWGFYCIWDMSNGIYSADYRLWKKDGSGPEPWIVAHENGKSYASEDEGWYKADGYYTGADGEKWQSHIANFFAFSPEGAAQLEAKRKELNLVDVYGTFVAGLPGTKIVKQQEIAPLIAIVNATRPSVQLSKNISLSEGIANNSDLVNPLNYDNTANTKNWIELGGTEFKTNFTYITPYALQQWLFSNYHKDDRQGIFYSYPPFTLTTDEPNPYGVYNRTYLKFGGFIIPETGPAPNPIADTATNVFSVMRNSKNMGKLISTIHTGMAPKPAYHCNEVLDVSNIVHVFLPKSDLSYNYQFNSSNVALLSGLSAENYFSVIPDASHDLHIYFYKQRPYQFEYMKNTLNVNEFINPEFNYSGYNINTDKKELYMSGDHIFIMRYKTGTSEIVNSAGSNNGIEYKEINKLNAWYNNTILEWSNQLTQNDPIRKIGLGAAEREYMYENPNLVIEGPTSYDKSSKDDDSKIKYVVINFVLNTSNDISNDLQEYKQLMASSELGATDSSGTDSFWNIYKKYGAESIYVLDMSGTNHSVFTEIWPSKAAYEKDFGPWYATYYIIREDMSAGISLEDIVAKDYTDASYASLSVYGDTTKYKFLPCYNTPKGKKWFYHFIKVYLASRPALVGTAPDVNYSGGLTACVGKYQYVNTVNGSGDLTFTDVSSVLTFQKGPANINCVIDISSLNATYSVNHYNVHSSNDICGTAFDLLLDGNDSFVLNTHISTYVDLSALYNN